MFGNKKGGDDNSKLMSAGVALADKTTKNESLCKSLPLKTRIYGWLICMCVGLMVSFVAGGMVRKLASAGTIGVVKFMVLYTIGTICSLCSGLFLWGPVKQCKSMFDPTRRITTIVYLTCILLVFGSCVTFFTWKDESGNPKLPTSVILLLVLIQYIAYFWYALSFIPFGRKMFCKCCKNLAEDKE